MKTITVMDPVTRIEGHMKVEISIDTVAGRREVVDARCTGTLFRGFETLLLGRSPLDAPVITQRICGVCPISHGQTSVLALENVSNWLPPSNARLLRNLTLGANFIQSHILHFYLLAALDFVAGPAVSPWAPAWETDMRPGLDAVGGHLPDALEARRRAHEMGAVFGGKMPTTHAFVPGGFTATPTTAALDQYREHLDFLLRFIDNTYLPDVLAVGDVYRDHFEFGTGCNNLMAYGVFEMDDTYSTKLLQGGYIEDGAPSVQPAFNTKDITESVKYSWYASENEGFSPMAGATTPLYPKDAAYSWLKAPRLLDKPFEVGPLARMRINGDYSGGASIMDRHVARAEEAKKIALAMSDWLDALSLDQSSYDDYFDQYSGFGVGLTEAPRGALGHWVQISDRKISHYQVITPTCWNASPRDAQDVPGPMEQALIGTPVENSNEPVEALRVIHSFDPCLSCAVHVTKPDSKPLVIHTGAK